MCYPPYCLVYIVLDAFGKFGSACTYVLSGFGSQYHTDKNVVHIFETLRN